MEKVDRNMKGTKDKKKSKMSSSKECSIFPVTATETNDSKLIRNELEILCQ